MTESFIDDSGYRYTITSFDRLFLSSTNIKYGLLDNYFIRYEIIFFVMSYVILYNTIYL